jgi:hypothetical protein
MGRRPLLDRDRRRARLAALTLATLATLTTLATLATLAAACAGDDGSGPAESILPRAPIGDGFCCPIDQIECDCFRNGGWVAVDDLEQCRRICDLAPPETRIAPDEHGCPVLTGPISCLGTSTRPGE